MSAVVIWTWCNLSLKKLLSARTSVKLHAIMRGPLLLSLTHFSLLPVINSSRHFWVTHPILSFNGAHYNLFFSAIGNLTGLWQKTTSLSALSYSDIKRQLMTIWLHLCPRASSSSRQCQERDQIMRLRSHCLLGLSLIIRHSRLDNLT